MTRWTSHLEVLNRLPQSNCRKCRQASCLAFSVAVFQGKNTLASDSKIPRYYSSRISMLIY
jgi:ArsR family metal-binding transcriptional regulator